MLTFSELEIRFGVAAAYHYLLEIEKAANIVSDELATVDPELRLAQALRAQEAA